MEVCQSRTSGLRNAWSKSQVLGEGRNPSVDALYRTIVNVDEQLKADQPSQNKPFTVDDLLARKVYAEGQLSDSIVSQHPRSIIDLQLCFGGDVTTPRIASAKQQIFQDFVKVAKGLGADHPHEGIKSLAKIAAKPYSPENWAKAVKESGYRTSSFAKTVRSVTHFGRSVQNNRVTNLKNIEMKEHLSLLYRAMENFSENVRMFPGKVKNLADLMRAQQKREAIAAFEKEIDRLSSGGSDYISRIFGAFSVVKIKAYELLIKELEKADNGNSVQHILDSHLGDKIPSVSHDKASNQRTISIKDALFQSRNPDRSNPKSQEILTKWASADDPKGWVDDAVKASHTTDTAAQPQQIKPQ